MTRIVDLNDAFSFKLMNYWSFFVWHLEKNLIEFLASIDLMMKEKILVISNIGARRTHAKIRLFNLILSLANVFPPKTSVYHFHSQVHGFFHCKNVCLFLSYFAHEMPATHYDTWNIFCSKDHMAANDSRNTHANFQKQPALEMNGY